MIGVHGLRAYVFTLHQTSLALALAVAVLATVIIVLVARSRALQLSSIALLTFFLAVLSTAHVALSRVAGFAPLTVEVIRLDRDPEDPPPPSSTMSMSRPAPASLSRRV